MGLLQLLGGEAGCRSLAEAFYARVGREAVLRPLFPGKSLRCATEEFAAFLIQFLHGDEGESQFRWWLSLRESHARFQISAEQRAAWLRQMFATVDELGLPDEAREGLRDFFLQTSAYASGRERTTAPTHAELGARWAEQQKLDDAVAAIAEARDADAIRLASELTARPSVCVGLLARMLRSQRPALIAYALERVGADAGLPAHRWNGRTLLHEAAAAGCPAMVTLLLKLGMGPNVPDAGGHPPLYSAANECAEASGVVRLLVAAGAEVNARTGVTAATALHMAARRGHLEVARTLLELGADARIPDRKGDTPLDRAVKCRRQDVAELLRRARG